ncbi:MAG: glycosyltransferase [Luteimonas sp.]
MKTPKATSPQISVILTAFNAAKFIRVAIKSVLLQTFTDFELIIVDDGSTDNSLSVIRRAVQLDHRCIVVSRGNKGIVESSNEALALSRGKYVFKMDADDSCHKERFALQFAYLEAHPRCVAVGTRVLLADAEMLPIIEMFLRLSHSEIDAENMRGHGSAICNPSVAMRRDAVVAVGGYRKDFECAEDLDLFLRLAEIGELANLPEVLLTYRQHLRSVGHSRRALQIVRAHEAVKSAQKRRGSQAAALAHPALSHDKAYDSLGDIHRKWVWQSLIGGHPATARKHALLALRKDPLHSGNLRLLACAIRGR